MNKYICPPNLKIGDKVVIVSPSGCIDKQYIEGATSVFENWGLKVEIAPHALYKIGRFAGTPLQRIRDLQHAMDDDSVRLIFCSRGGYGIVHLLEGLDFRGIRKNPKWLVGFSDITALHLAFFQNKLLSIHAPMARHLAEYPLDKSSVLLQETLFMGKQNYILDSHPLNKQGISKGNLIGGNLAVISALMGTSLMNLPAKTILFIEDVGEAPYKIDRMVWQLKLSGILSKLSGLIIGQFSDYTEDPLMYTSVYQSIFNLVKEYDYPVVFNFPVGHVETNYSLIHGSLAHLSVNDQKTILEF